MFACPTPDATLPNRRLHHNRSGVATIRMRIVAAANGCILIANDLFRSAFPLFGTVL
jgi:hypothetical protein